jgi:ligand-binding SRPBCC domain-containing protein
VRIHELTRITHVDRPLGEVFSFFADPANLELLTPSWLRFEVASPRPVEMRAGTRIDYRLRLHGFPVRWQSEITEWDPPNRFVDEQRRGPYRFWRHEHRFAEADGTDIIDFVQYAVPFDALSHKWLVQPDIEGIFDFREAKMRELFPSRS